MAKEKKGLSSLWEFLKEIFTEFSNDKVPRLSAALAYYTIFSLPPMLILLISVLGTFLGKEAVQGQIFNHINAFVGPGVATQVEDIIKSTHLNADNHIATIIGIVTLFFGATGIFSEVQDSINTIWGIKAKPKRGILKLMINRVLSFSIILILGLILFLSLIINTVIEAFSEKLNALFPQLAIPLLYIINLGVTIFIITILFAIIFKVLPDARIRWRDVAIGAMVTAFLFMMGKFAIGFYIQQTNMGTAYGAAGSIIVLLLWVYYSSIILFFGAEFTQLYAKRYGTEIVPKEYAVFIIKKEIERKTQPKADHKVMNE